MMRKAVFIMSDTYENIRSLCDAKHIRVAELAREIGIRNSAFTELKMGRTKSLSAKTLKKIADYFGVSVEYVMEGFSPADNDGVDEELARMRRVVMNRVNNLSKRDVELLMQLTDAMITLQPSID